MPRIPSAQDVNRQQPQISRAVVGMPIDPTGRAMQQLGDSVMRAAHSVHQEQQQQQREAQQEAEKAAYYEERLIQEEKQKTVRIQKATAGSSFAQSLNEWNEQSLSDTDYATMPQRFGEFARTALKQHAASISDEEERTMFTLRGEEQIADNMMKMRSHAHNQRNEQLRSGLDERVTRSVNSIAATDDVQTINNLLHTTMEEANALEAAGVITRAQKNKTLEHMRNVAAFTQLDKKTPEALLKMFKGEGDVEVQSTGNAVLDEAIDKVAATRNVPRSYLVITAQIESNGDAYAKNPKSSAAGAFQLTQETAKKLGVNPYDVRASTDAAAMLYIENKQRFENELGRTPTDGELYVMHQQGAPNAMALFHAAQQGESAFDALSRIKDSKIARDSIVNNGGTLDMSAGDFIRTWTKKYEGKEDADILQYLTPSQQEQLKNKALSHEKNTIKSAWEQARNATIAGLDVPLERFDDIAKRALAVDEPEMAEEIKNYGTMQLNLAIFAGRDLRGMESQLTAMREENDPKQAQLTKAMQEVYREKVTAVARDPLSYYAGAGLIPAQPPIDFALDSLSPEQLGQALAMRRASIEKIEKFEHGRVSIPILADDEIKALKHEFDEGNPEQLAQKLGVLQQGLTQSEQSRLAQKAFSHDSIFSAALSSEPIIAQRMIEGARLPDPYPAKEFKDEFRAKIADMAIPASHVTGIEKAVFAYTKRLHHSMASNDKAFANLEAGEATMFNAEALDRALADVMGDIVTINDSKVFSFRDASGRAMDEDSLQDAFDDLRDEDLDELPHWDFKARGVDMWRDQARLVSAGDGVYHVLLDGAVLSGADGEPYMLDMRKILSKRGTL